MSKKQRHGTCLSCKVQYRWAGAPEEDGSSCPKCYKRLTRGGPSGRPITTQSSRRPLDYQTAMRKARGGNGPAGAPIVGGLVEDQLLEEATEAKEEAVTTTEKKTRRPRRSRGTWKAIYGPWSEWVAIGRTRSDATGMIPWLRGGLSAAQTTMTKRLIAALSARLSVAITQTPRMQGEISKSLGYSTGAVGQWSSEAALSIPSVRELCLIAHELGIEPARFMPTLAELRGEAPLPDHHRLAGELGQTVDARLYGMGPIAVGIGQRALDAREPEVEEVEPAAESPSLNGSIMALVADRLIARLESGETMPAGVADLILDRMLGKVTVK